MELGLTGYVKSGYHMITDYMPDELMLVSGAMNPLVMTGTMAEAQFGKQMFEDPKERVIKELRVYMVEIKETDRLGLKKVSEQLFENYRQEREWIVNQYITAGDK